MHELVKIAFQLHQKGLSVLSDEASRLAVEISGDPIENVLSAYRHIHGVDISRRLAGNQTVCAHWQGDNDDWCDHYAQYTYRGQPLCYKHFRFVARKEPTHHDLLASLRATATIRKNNLPSKQRCPFGLSIPRSCSFVGEAITLMEPDEQDFKQNRRIYNEAREGNRCPYAAKIVKTKKAVDCNFGTSTEGLETPKLYHSSPIYPRLWEGFNTVNLDRNYHQYRDFNYVSVYGSRENSHEEVRADQNS